MRSTILAILAILSVTQATANTDTEPNTDWQDALRLPQGRTVAGTQSDDDWYVINAPTGDRIVVDLTFTHAEGDIDMRLYDDKEPTLDSGVIGVGLVFPSERGKRNTSPIPIERSFGN